MGTWYLASFSWSMMVVTGTGGTDFYPSYRSHLETTVVMMLVVIGALLWTQVLALFCDVATNSHPGLSEFRQTLVRLFSLHAQRLASAATLTYHPLCLAIGDDESPPRLLTSPLFEPLHA